MAVDTIQAGYADTPVTPETPCGLVGYGVYLGRTATGVLDELKARAVYLGDQRGGGCLIIAYDLIGLTVAQADRVRGLVARSCDLPREAVLLSFTHTHSGPASMYLRGMGEVDGAYLGLLERASVDVATRAADDARPAHARWNVQEIEPIGFNRVTGLLEPLDTRLAHVALERDDTTIYLVSYACHAVTLGPNTLVSADYPGRLCRAVEARGKRCVFLQGFCGDIDPFRNKVRWGSGTEADLDYYGAHLASRLDMSDAGARPISDPAIAAAEERVSLPLERVDGDAVERLSGRLREIFKTVPAEKVERFVAEWRAEAIAAIPRLGPNPSLDGIPVHVVALGPVSLAALPGEVFCRLGLELRSEMPGLVPLGYANGNVGYIPTAAAYDRREDYACFAAPRFYGVAAFQPCLERVLFDAVRRLAGRVGARPTASAPAR